MTPTDYRSALARLGLTVAERDTQAALGVAKRTLKTWARRGPPPYGARLVEALLKLKTMEKGR